MTTSRPTTIAIIGATGQQGGAVVDALLEHEDLRIRALVRDPAAQKSAALAARGVELIPGEIADAAALDRLLSGADAAFAMTTMGGPAGTDGEIADGRAIAEAARRADLPHLVYSSVGGAERGTGIGHFESKRRVEERIEELGLHATFVRPVFFMENLLGMGVSVEDGSVVLREPLPDGVPLQMIAVRDIGRVAAAIILGGTAVEGGSVEIAGDELTGSEIASVFGARSGLPSRYEQLPLETVAQYGDAASMFAWLSEPPAYQADIQATRALEPQLLDLRSWLEQIEWRAEGQEAR